MADKPRIEGREFLRRAEVSCEACIAGGKVLWSSTGDEAIGNAVAVAVAHARHRGIAHTPVVVVTVSTKYEVVS